MFGILLFGLLAVETVPPALGDPLDETLFRTCPELLNGSLNANDADAMSNVGFKMATGGNGLKVLSSIKNHEISIQAHAPFDKICPVEVLGAADTSTARLVGLFERRGLKVEKNPSPIGGQVINALDASNDLVATSQIFGDRSITLVIKK